jgi:hypothetical protein
LLFEDVCVSISNPKVVQHTDHSLRRAHPKHEAKSIRDAHDANAYKVSRSWIWEILSIVVAVGLIVAIAVLLATNDGKPAPNWGEQVNLNALLATLSTVLRAMLVVVVSQIISQRKWEWFESIRERPLTDLKKFDAGSRGIPGAMQLLPTVIWRDPISFAAAFILMISFLVGPAVQQASRTAECIVASGSNASLPFAHYVPGRSGYVTDVERDDLGVPAPDLITAILSAVADPKGMENRIRGSCSTGNCTFPDGDPASPNPGSSHGKDSVTHSTVAMCNICTDVSSLVRRETSTCPYPTLSLPNNMSVSRGCGDREVVRIQPDMDLSWMGDLLTTELRSFSRWAYVNASFIALNSYANETVAAATCSLYPCVQTYTTSIDKNEVSEIKVGSQVMRLDMLSNSGVGEIGNHNALDSVYKSYVAVKSPCQVERKLYDSNKNASAEVNGTDLALRDFTDYGAMETARLTLMNITAPEECIYRQNPQFVVAISRVLNNDIFNGSCSLVKTFNCRKAGRSRSDDKFLQGLGTETVLRALYGKSYSSLSNQTTGLSNVTEWFDQFADALTRRFRSDYGSARERNGMEVILPIDEIQGLAWQTTACVSMRRVWLVLPITLTSITAALAVWTIATNWRHRHCRPVWKDDILPLIFYGRDLVDSILDEYRYESSEPAPQPENADQTTHKKVPFESSEMQKIGRSTAVTVPWLRAMNDTGEAPAVTKRAKWSWHSKANRKDTVGSHFPGTNEAAPTLPETHGDQTASGDADLNEDDQALASAQGDGHAQVSPVTQGPDYFQSGERVGSQQSCPMSLQRRSSDEASVWTFDDF